MMITLLNNLSCKGPAAVRTSHPTILALIIFLSSIVACVPDPVTIEIPQADPQLVIATQIIGVPGTDFQTVLVQVSRSFGALEFSEAQADTLPSDLLTQILATQARVTLDYGGNKDTLVNLDNGLYASFNTPFIEDETYTLSVFDSTSELTVSAVTALLPQVSWDTIGYDFETIRFDFQDTSFVDSILNLYPQFVDLAGENFYMINVYPLSTLAGAAEPTQNAILGSQNTETIAISDQLFANTTYGDTLQYVDFKPGDTVAVALSHISAEYYGFLTTRQRSGTSIFAQLLQEPVNFPTNVVGGLGFFNMHLPNFRVLVLEE